MKTAQTTAPDNIKSIKQTVETLLNRLRPLLQDTENLSPNTQQTVAGLEAVNNQLDQLAVQVGQLEQIKAQQTQTQATDDKPEFWRSNLDYGEREKKVEALISLADRLDEHDLEDDATAIDDLIKQLAGE